MLNIYRKMSLKQPVSLEEEIWARNQFKELLKVIGLGFIVFLPFSPITMPFCIKLGKIFGIDIIPKNFKDLK